MCGEFLPHLFAFLSLLFSFAVIRANGIDGLARSVLLAERRVSQGDDTVFGKINLASGWIYHEYTIDLVLFFTYSNGNLWENYNIKYDSAINSMMLADLIYDTWRYGSCFRDIKFIFVILLGNFRAEIFHFCILSGLKRRYRFFDDVDLPRRIRYFVKPRADDGIGLIRLLLLLLLLVLLVTLLISQKVYGFSGY